MDSPIDLEPRTWSRYYREGPNGAQAEWPGKCEWQVGGVSYWHIAAVAEMLVAACLTKSPTGQIVTGVPREVPCGPDLPEQPNRHLRTRTSGGVGGAPREGRPYPDPDCAIIQDLRQPLWKWKDYSQAPFR